MKTTNHAIAVFPDHTAAERAVKTLGEEGFALTDLGIVGNGHHTGGKVTGLNDTGDRVRFWGSRGALWGWFLGEMMPNFPVMGHVVVLGYLATAPVSTVEGAASPGGIGTLGASAGGAGLVKGAHLVTGWGALAMAATAMVGRIFGDGV